MSGFSPQSGSCPLLVKRGSLQIFWRFWVSRGEGQPTPLLEKTSSALRVSVAILLASPKVAKNPIVGPTSRVFAANVGRQVPLFAGQPPDDCGPLHLSIYCAAHSHLESPIWNGTHHSISDTRKNLENSNTP